MEIYFVRHGETGGNVAHRHQAEDTPLTTMGKKQALEAAEIIKTFEPTHLLTSSLVRAIETASAIGEMCELVPETSYSIIELERPQHLYGHFHKSPRSLFFYVRWYLGRTSAEEGESYAEMRLRIGKVKEQLAQYPADARVVVVTHSVFLSLFLAHMCREKPLSPLQALQTFRTILSMRNTHVAPVLFDANAHPQMCPWILQKRV